MFGSVFSLALTKWEEKRETERKIPPFRARGGEEEDWKRKLTDVFIVGDATEGRLEGNEKPGEVGR